MRLNYYYLKYSKILIVLAVIFIGCKKKINNFNDFRNYCKLINIELKNSSAQNNIVFLIYENSSCNSCINYTFNKLDSSLSSIQKKNIYFDLVGGESYDSATIKVKYPELLFYIDRKELFYSKKIFSYETQLPVILFIQDKRIKIIELLTTNKEEVISLICKYLE